MNSRKPFTFNTSPLFCWLLWKAQSSRSGSCQFEVNTNKGCLLCTGLRNILKYSDQQSHQKELLDHVIRKLELRSKRGRVSYQFLFGAEFLQTDQLHKKLDAVQVKFLDTEEIHTLASHKVLVPCHS